MSFNLLTLRDKTNDFIPKCFLQTENNKSSFSTLFYFASILQNERINRKLLKREALYDHIDNILAVNVFNITF